MNFVKQTFLFAAVAFFCVHTTTVGMNLSRAHDIFFRPPASQEKFMQMYWWVEHGVKQFAYDSSGESINELRYCNCTQDALAMLNGFDDVSPIGQLRAKLHDVVDNGIRGHYCVTGDLKMHANAAFAWRFFFNHNLTLGAYLPIRSMALENVCWRELTQMEDEQDARVKACLTDDLFNNVFDLGKELELCGWHRNGVGDLTILLEFLRDFEQPKPLLKNVLLNLRGGLMIPSGLRQDPDKIAAIPFGNDGATGAVFGGGLELLFGSWFKWGFDVELTHLFGNARERRIKTAVDQTEFLLLQKLRAYKDWGMQQQFTIFAQMYHFFKGLSFKAGYRFFKQGDSELALCDNQFSPAIANSACSVEDWTAHDVLLQLSYDFTDCCERVEPLVALHARIPFNGKRALVSNTIGVMMSLNF